MQADVLSIEEQIDELEKVYAFREPAEVRAYLMANPDLLPLVREAATKLGTSLPGDGRLVLDVVVDPGDETDPGELFAVYQSTLPPSIMRPALNRLIREWLVPVGRSSVGRFNIGFS
jgi:hypothetical protein